MCYRHDDQWEHANARVIDIRRDETPGTFAGRTYSYQVWLTCRHISLKRLDALGGPVYCWHRFPWNRVTRFVPATTEQGV